MQSPPQGWGTGWLAFGLAVAGVVASVLLGLSVASDNTATTEQWLADRGEIVQASTEGTVKTAIDGLSALAAFFENSESVTQVEFEGFVRKLDPAIRLLGVGYMPVVPAEGLDAYVAAKREMTPEYAITSFDDDAQLQPVARDRSVYYPVELFYSGPFLLESVTDTPATVAALSVGYDAGSPDEWRPSLESTIAGDTPTVSAFVEFGDGDKTLAKAFIVSVPVHDEGGTVVGMVAAPMVDLVLADFALTRGVTWTISSGDARSAAVEGPVWDQMIELPGATWHLVVVPTDESLAEMPGIPPWQAVLAGLAVTGLITYVFLLARLRYRTRSRLREMERAAVEKDRFLASVSHEIRTPLTVVAGLAHELKDRPEAFQPGEAAELLAMVARHSDEAAAIVEDLLVAARADLGLVRVAHDAVDLHREAIRVVDATGLGITILGEQTWAWTDPSRLRQIMRNLVSNADRYGGPEKEIRFGSEDGSVWVEVVDSGPPIPLEDRGRIFDAYVSSSDESGPSIGAVGLGLFISQRLSELLDGRLAYRHDGSCSIFRLTLPATDEPTSKALVDSRSVESPC